MQRYFKFAVINKKSDKYISKSITKINTTKKLRNENKPLSYAGTRELLLHSLVDVRLKKANFRRHGLC